MSAFAAPDTAAKPDTRKMHKNMGMMGGMDMGNPKENPAQDSKGNDSHHPKK